MNKLFEQVMISVKQIVVAFYSEVIKGFKRLK